MISNIAAPVIIIGMHRSGTTMVAQLLQHLGLFVGEDLDPNCEPEYFIRLNDWLLKEAGGAWDQPSAMAKFYGAGDDFIELNVDYLREILSTWPVSSFIGKLAYLKGDTPFNMQRMWGWKDPRNTITLPIWLRLFPEAKVLHIHRNGIDVAASLQVRAQRELSEAIAVHERLKRMWRYKFGIKRYGFVESSRVLNLENAFSLWEEYLEYAYQYDEILGDRILHVCYEVLLEEPLSSLSEICKFCEMPSDEDSLLSVISGIKGERGLAFQQNSELMKFYQQVRERPMMLRLGYAGY
ncbi:MAG: sulfotransferase [Gallionella sp.]